MVIPFVAFTPIIARPDHKIRGIALPTPFTAPKLAPISTLPLPAI
jgi:hypothetical protein